MANFIVAFRLSEDSTHSQRQEMLMAEIRKISSGSIYWKEAASFAVFRSPLSADEIRDLLTQPAFFSAAKDLVVVIDVQHQRKAVKGDVNFPRTLQYCLGF